MNQSKFAAKKAQINRAKKSHQFKAALALLNGLALEFAEPAKVEPTPKMIDERLVYQFLDLFVECGNSEPDLLFGTFDYEDLADFFKNATDVKEKLFQLWRDCGEIEDDEYFPLSQYDCEVAA